jgi:hypothetical protein
VEYRWVTKDGQSSDPGWKTLSFTSGGPHTRQVVHTESPARSGSNELHVEVRQPVKASSNSGAYKVTCKEETPTGGASSSYSPPGSAPPGG